MQKCVDRFDSSHHPNRQLATEPAFMRTAVRARSVLRDVAFSGCGWLSPFHLGAWSHLQSVGLVDRTTRLLGASGGALIAAGISLDVEPKALMGHLLGLSAWARSNGIIRGNLEGELRVRIGGECALAAMRGSGAKAL